MGKWPAVLVIALTITSSIVGYFALQVLAAFVAFCIYGSGETFSAKSLNVSALFVAGQLIIVNCLFYRKTWVKKVATLLLALLIPLGLFLALEGSSLLPD